MYEKVPYISTFPCIKMLRYTSGSKYPDLQSGSKDSWVRIPHAVQKVELI